MQKYLLEEGFHHMMVPVEKALKGLAKEDLDGAISLANKIAKSCESTWHGVMNGAWWADKVYPLFLNLDVFYGSLDLSKGDIKRLREEGKLFEPVGIEHGHVFWEKK